LFVFERKIREEILRYTSLSPSQFRLRFRFETRRKKRRRRHVVGVLFRQVSFGMFVRFRIYWKGCTYEKRSLKRRNIEKKRENKREKKRKTTKHDFLLLKYKIIIWTVHFFSHFSSSSLFSHTVRLTRVYYCFKDTLHRLHRHWRWRQKLCRRMLSLNNFPIFSILQSSSFFSFLRFAQKNTYI